MANSVFVFLVPLAYAIPSLVLYLVTVVIIIWYWQNIKSSFYQFYIFEFLMNIMTYWNGIISLRLPAVTCSDCQMASYYRNGHRSHSSFMNQFQYAMQFHMAYVQYTTTAIVALNRLSIIYKRDSFEPLWRKYSWVVMIFIYCAPFGFTHPIFFHNTYFRYDSKGDKFALLCDYKSSAMFECLLPVMIATTVITMVANVVSFIRLAKLPYTPRQLEKSFLAVTILASLVQVIGTVLSALMLASTLGSNIFAYTGRILPLVSDALTLIHPYLLIIFCAGVSHFHKLKLKEDPVENCLNSGKQMTKQMATEPRRQTNSCEVKGTCPSDNKKFSDSLL